MTHSWISDCADRWNKREQTAPHGHPCLRQQSFLQSVHWATGAESLLWTTGSWPGSLYFEAALTGWIASEDDEAIATAPPSYDKYQSAAPAQP